MINIRTAGAISEYPANLRRFSLADTALILLTSSKSNAHT